MNIASASVVVDGFLQKAQLALGATDTYIQLFVIIAIYGISFALAYKIRHSVGLIHNEPEQSAHPVRKLAFNIGGILFPLLAIILLQVSTVSGEMLEFQPWLIQTAITIAVLLFFYSVIRIFVQHQLAASLFKWIGLPILFLHPNQALEQHFP